MKKKMRFLNLLAVLIVLFAGVHQADAANLRARSQVLSPANGYPIWYQDNNNLALTLCLDRLNGLCLVDPTAQPFPANKADISSQNFPGEAFYYLADTAGVSPGGTIDLTLYEAALEGGFAAAVVDGGQAVFTRIRIRANVTVPGTYTVRHPYGVDTFAVGAIGQGPEINFTEDIPGLVAGFFDNALASRVGPFLTRADGSFAIDPATGNRFLGIPGVPVAVQGGVGGVNSVTITGPGTDTLTLDTFSLMGKVIGLAITPPVDGTNFGVAKLLPAAGVTKTFTLANLTATPFTPVIVANDPNSNPVALSPDFTIVPAGCAAPLAPTATCNFDVTFVPVTDGVKIATILVNGPDVPPAQVLVTGTGDGIAPTVALDAPILFTKLTTQTITGTVADNVGGAGIDPATSVQVTVNAAAPAPATVTGGTWSFSAGLIDNAVNNVSVTAADLALPLPGNISAAVPGTITVDSILPAVAINNVTSPTRSPSQTITGTASDTNGISTLTVSVNGIVKGTTAVAGNDTWSFDVTEMNLNADNIITATATDPAGNSTTSEPRTITVDTGINPFTLTAVTSPTNALTQLIGGTIEANSTVTVAVNGGAAQPATVIGTNWSFTVSLTNEGNNTFVVSATDSIGNTASQPTATIVLDTQVNPFTLNAVTSLTKAASQAISGTVEAGSTVSVTVNGGTALPATVTGTNWNFTVSLTAPDGIKSIVVSATDALGNTASQPTATIVLDTTPPELALTVVSTLTRSNSQVIGGTVEAGATVAVNGQPATVTGTTWSFTVSLTAPDGAKNFVIIATDAATNATTVTSSITLDTTAPALILNAFATPTRINTQTISGTVEAGATVKVTIGSGTAADATVTGATWSFNVAGLVEGANGITVTATDPVGNPASQQSSILIILPDGKITGAATVSLADAMKSLQFAAGLIQPTLAETLHADVAPLVNRIPSPNGKVDTGDVVLVLRKVVDPTSW